MNNVEGKQPMNKFILFSMMFFKEFDKVIKGHSLQSKNRRKRNRKFTMSESD